MAAPGAFNTAFNTMGGIGQIGGTGAAGAFEGMVEGIKLKSLLESQGFQNQLRQIDAMIGQQQLQRGQQPTYHIQGDRQIKISPTGGAPEITEIPQTETEKSRSAELKARADRETAAAEAAGRPNLSQTQAATLRPLYDAYTKALATGDRGKIEKALLDLFQARNAIIGDKGGATKLQRGRPGDVFFDPSDPSSRFTVPGTPAGQQTKETIEESVRIVPGKDITTDTGQMGKLREALPQVINEIAGSPNIEGWMEKGPTVRVKGYPAPVRREDVIKHAMRRAADVDVEVRWDPSAKAWVLIKARIPTKREPMEKRRTVGPPRSSSQADDDEED